MYMPSKLVNKAKSVDVVIDLQRLTAAQRKNITKFVLRGWCTPSSSVTSFIAGAVLRKHKLPHLLIDKYEVKWSCLPPDDEFFVQLEGAAALEKLRLAPNDYALRHINNAINQAQLRERHGDVRLYYLHGEDGEFSKNVKNIRHSIPKDHPVIKELEAIESGKRKTYTIKFKG